jgi:peptide deformylase
MSEIGLKIRVFGDSALRKKAKHIGEVTQRHRDILSLMSRIMYEAPGIGLAAPQVGVSEAMIVVDVGSGLYKLINPKVVKKEGAQVLEEGCLSVPGVCIKVKRANKVLVNALDESAKPIEIEAEGLLACCLQHEIDHLHGKLIVDYSTLLDKIKTKKRLAALKKKAQNERLSQSEAQSCQLQL